METMTEAIDLTLPDGSVRTVPAGTTPLDGGAPRSVRAWPRTPWAPSSTAARSTCACRSTQGGAFRIFTTKSPEAGEFIRHSAEHVLADAVKRLWPEAEIDAGRQDHSEKFQYDFRFPRPSPPRTSQKIEDEDARDPRRGERLRARRGVARGGRADLPRDGRDAEGRAPQGHPRGGDDHPLPRRPASPTSAAARTCRRLAQIGAVKLLEASGVYLQGRREERAPAAHLRHRLRLPRRRWTSTWQPHGGRRGRATTAGWAPELDLFSFNPLAPAMPFLHPKGALDLQSR